MIAPTTITFPAIRYRDRSSCSLHPNRPCNVKPLRSRLISGLKVELVGSTITACPGAAYGNRSVDFARVFWCTLNDEKSGVLAIIPGQLWQGTIPDGFLIDNSDSLRTSTRYLVETLDGTGIPFDTRSPAPTTSFCAGAGRTAESRNPGPVRGSSAAVNLKRSTL